MEPKRKSIELVEVSPEFCLDTLYSNESYDEPFVIETTYGTFHTVTLIWEQGHGNNYRFAIGEGDDGYILPKYVAYIEVR